MHTRRYLPLVSVLLYAWFAAVPASAHHSLTGQYDMNAPASMTGTITKVEWINPHIYIYLDVKGNDGRVINWSLETYPPAFLRRAGLTKAALGIGQTVTARVFIARASSVENLAFVNQLTYPDGRQVTLGGGDR